MADKTSSYSKSGVRIADDFRSNLIVDRYDPVFVGVRASKIQHLRSENSEDVVTWNVFRSLRHIDPGVWLPGLTREAVGRKLAPEAAAVSLWLEVPPPPSLLLEADKGESEIDVVIEAPGWVWFIEAKYRSDISTKTTTRPERDQVLRNIDVGSYYAGVREFYFSLLVKGESTSPVGAEVVRRYAELDAARAALADHRPDGLSNLKAVTLMTWAMLGRALDHARQSAPRQDERSFAERACTWLAEKGLAT